jgi:branched-chain amino acid transport system substrate-binding protein
LSVQTRKELYDYQQVLSLLDEDVISIQAQVEALKSPESPPFNPPSFLTKLHNFPNYLNNRRNSVYQFFSRPVQNIRRSRLISFFRRFRYFLIATLVLTLILIMNKNAIYYNFFWDFQKLSSFGEESLLSTSEANNCFFPQQVDGRKEREKFDVFKHQAMKLVKEGTRPSDASKDFRNALEICQNAPETLIFWNNAQADAQEAGTITVAVVVPDKRPDDAVRMLRGFAQAQNEVNNPVSSEDNVKLKLLIVKDDDTQETATAIAERLVKEPDIKAVLGHWTSSTSLAAAKVYESEQMVFITPISIINNTASELSQLKSYFFRTNASVNKGAQRLVDFMRNSLKGYQPVIFYDSRNKYYSESLKKTFAEEFIRKVDSSYEIFNNSYDLAAGLNASSVIAEINKKYQEDRKDRVLVFFPSNKSDEDAITIAKKNLEAGTPGKPLFPILGDMANLAIPKTLREGKEAVEGMVLVPSWSQSNRQSTAGTSIAAVDIFAATATNLWKGEVDWTSAMSYNAAQAVTSAIMSHISPVQTITNDTSEVRKAIQENLRSGLEISGASGKFKFLPNGSTNVEVQPTIVCKSDRQKFSRTGFDFFRLPENLSSYSYDKLCENVKSSQTPSVK